MKSLVFTVTNELNYDQRMQRICTSLAGNGYRVLLIGRKGKNAPPLVPQPFMQKRLRCFCAHGPLFFIEFNIRLVLFLLFRKMDAICAIDLDTILPCYFVSVLRRKPRIYDAHELFTEQKEIVTRPLIHKIWLAIERFAVPRFRYGYTVNHFIQQELHRRYAVNYGVIRNLPYYDNTEMKGEEAAPFFIYQGAINDGRGFDSLIPAMQNVNLPLFLYGKGNYYIQTQELVKRYQLENKVFFKQSLLPEDLKKVTVTAYAGIMIVEHTGLNQYYSLANKFFDFMMAGIPQVCINFPEYKAINDQYHFALMVDDIQPQTLSDALNRLITDKKLYHTLRQNCQKAKQHLCWEKEEIALLKIYHSIFGMC